MVEGWRMIEVVVVWRVGQVPVYNNCVLDMACAMLQG